MGIEQSYIDIYREYAMLIKQNSSDVLNSLRDKGFELFRTMGFPDGNSENYKKTNLAERFSVDYGMDLRRNKLVVNPYEVFKCDVPGINSLLFFVVNDQFCSVLDDSVCREMDELEQQGVIVGSVAEYSKKRPDIFQKYYGMAARMEDDATVAFNTAFAQDGIFIYVPENVKVEKPIQLINVMSADFDFMANSRNLIVLEKGASAKVLVCGHSDKRFNLLANRVTEVFVGEGANYEHYRLENTHDMTTNIASLYVSQSASSSVLVNDITLHNGMTRNNVRVDLNGEHAELVLCGMAVGDKKEHIDNHTYINHSVSNCKSNELYKYVLNDEAKGIFTGRILVDKNAQKTEALQSNKNMCVSKSARMFTKPQLEIYADDVKCSHGATVGQIDETALFYMQARGISEKEARMLLMLAFTDDVIENIRVEALKAKIRLLVEKRYRGELSRCNGCDMCR